MTHIPISFGELFDKITILEIKRQRVQDEAKLRNIVRELDLLEKIRDQAAPRQPVLNDLALQLKELNEKLWDIEDSIRACEHRGDFGAGFVELARGVYRLNDQRADRKRQINTLLGSELVEEKQYSHGALAEDSEGITSWTYTDNQGDTEAKL
jgi:hypothetical protein